MRSSECSSGGHPAAWRAQDGSLWFSTLKGVASVKPGSGFDNPVPPLTAIEQVLIDGKSKSTDSIGEKIDSNGDELDSNSDKLSGDGDNISMGDRIGGDAIARFSDRDQPAASLTVPPGTERLTLH